MKGIRKRRFEFLVKRFPKRMQKKLVLLFMATVLVFVVLIGRITYINVSRGRGYTKIVLDQQQYDSRVIPYKRGDIVDRNGTKLATSERVYNVILDAYVLLSDEKCEDVTISALESCFGVDGEKVRTILEEDPESRYNILATGMSYEKAQEFYALEEEVAENAREIEKEQAQKGISVEEPVIKGVWLEDDYERIYPYGSLASDVIGFSVEGNMGAAGIESAYNDILNGTDGREYGYFSDDASLERTVKPAKNGSVVVSTIDLTLQSIVEKHILEFNQKYEGKTREGEPGSKNTAVIVMDPNTGEILAEASYPNFDLNNPRSLSYIYTKEKRTIGTLTYTKELWKKYTDAQWDSMKEDEQLEALNAMWRNFCVSDAYEPGSTAKPFTVAAGLESGKLTGKETYYCGGSKQYGPDTIACHERSGHGGESFVDAVANSCNVALMEMAEVVGAEDFTRYQHIFGFGEYNGIDLPGEAYTAGLLYGASEMKPVDLATNSFGQNFNVTMTQMAAAFSSLINGGYYYKPHIVKQIEDSSGNVLETKDPVLIRKTISAETCEKVKECLKAVVEYGTGKPVQVPGYDIGGKTGTAEKIPRAEGSHLLSFIGYAPLDKPEVVIYVVLDEPNVPDQSTSQYVLELSQKIMAEAFPYLNITRNGTAEETQDNGTDASQTGTDSSGGTTDWNSGWDSTGGDGTTDWNSGWDSTGGDGTTDWNSGWDSTGGDGTTDWNSGWDNTGGDGTTDWNSGWDNTGGDGTTDWNSGWDNTGGDGTTGWGTDWNNTGGDGTTGWNSGWDNTGGNGTTDWGNTDWNSTGSWGETYG